MKTRAIKFWMFSVGLGVGLALLTISYLLARSPEQLSVSVTHYVPTLTNLPNGKQVNGGFVTLGPSIKFTRGSKWGPLEFMGYLDFKTVEWENSKWREKRVRQVDFKSDSIVLLTGPITNKFKVKVERVSALGLHLGPGGVIINSFSTPSGTSEVIDPTTKSKGYGSIAGNPLFLP